MRPPERPEDTGELSAARPAAEEEDTAQAFVRHSAVMATGTFLSRVTGFLRLAAMAYALGVAESRLADAYNVANTTPNIIYDLALGGIISSVFIPVFVERLEVGGRERAWHTARSVLTLAIVGLTTLTLVGILLSGWIIRLYTIRAHGPEAEAERRLASFLLKWFLPQIIFYGFGAGVWTALLNAHRRFAWPMFAPILNNVIAIGTFFAFAALPGGHTPDTLSTSQRYVLAIGTTAGVVGMTLPLWLPLRRLGFRWRWTVDLRDAGVRKIARLSLWALVYVVVNQLGLLVVIVLAQSVQGGYTAYQAAFIFFQLPYAIFAVSIMTALLPSLSARWAEGERGTYRYQLLQGIRGTAFIVVPAAFGYIALAQPIVRLLLQHGVTESGSTRLIAGILRLFSIGLFSFCSFQLLLRAFYSMQDTRTPALINVLAVALNVLADIVFFRKLRVEGLALGHATAYTFAAVVSAIWLSRRIEGLQIRLLAKPIGQILIGGALAGLAGFVVAGIIGRSARMTWWGPQAVQVGLATVAGILVYVAIAFAFRMEELAILRRVVLGRIARR